MLEGVLNYGIRENTFETQEKEITPTTNIQEITPDAEYDGISKVIVNAVTSDIDENITPNNIVDGVSILGVEGTAQALKGEEKTVKSSLETQTITPSEDKNGITKVIVEPIELEEKTFSLNDENIEQNNVINTTKDGISKITIEALNPQSKSATLDFSSNDTNTISYDQGYKYLKQVTINKDSDLLPENIKKDTNVYGVVGTYEGTGGTTIEGEEISVKSTTTSQTITPSDGKNAITKVTVEAIEVQDKTIEPDFASSDTMTITKDTNYDYLNQVSITKDEDLIATNIKKDVNIFGVTGTYEGGGTATPTLEDLTVTPTKQQQVFTHEDSDGYDNVTVAAIPSNYIEPTGTLQITENGTHDVTNYANVNANITAQAMYSPRYISFYNYKGTELDEEISFLNTSNMTGMLNMFNGCSNLTALNLLNFNTSNVTDMSYMFHNCSKLTTLDLSSFDTSKVTNMSYMFRMSGITTLNVSSFDTSNVTNMKYMFSYAEVPNLDLSNFVSNSDLDMSYMFQYGSSIKSINLSSITNVKSMYSAFDGCTQLNLIDIRNLNTDSVTSYSNMFKNVCDTCKIIVKDETAKTWVLERKSTLTNVVTVAELETE